ncbi:MAG TPA: MaoC/PaaZ C-terminal domain-containing protein [Dermatophilaceae bacterium]|nr:MaoC/PaaZ C-terminal domain-containing protein [Dermatophilaceae bacterium]
MNDARTLTLDSTPNLTVLFARAAATSIGRGGPLQDVQVRHPRTWIRLGELAAYDKVCGFALRDTLPATYLHVLVFPLQATLMADRRFPLGMPGLVHVRNRIVQHRPVDAGEPLTLRASARALRPHEKGAQIDLVGEVRVGHELVWEGVSTYLSRGASVPGETEPAQHVAVDLGPDAPANAVWDVPGDMGRRYATVSGDVDPMHLSSLTARAFGFPGALVQGMWSKAHALAAIEGRLPDAYVVDVDFSEPLLLPSVVNFFVAQQDLGWDLAVRPTEGAGDHLRGTVRAL